MLNNSTSTDLHEPQPANRSKIIGPFYSKTNKHVVTFTTDRKTENLIRLEDLRIIFWRVTNNKRSNYNKNVIIC